MKILIVGGGGREHALAWKICRSNHVEKLYCAPGNPGIAVLEKTECVELAVDAIDALLTFSRDNQIDLTVVGPEIPLSGGIVDAFNEAGLKIFGPTRLAAEIESSKIFAKNLMQKYDIPTAAYETFDDVESALDYVSVRPDRDGFVVKADGLAAGKGVFICKSGEEAASAIRSMMVDRQFGTSGSRIIIEEFMQGDETSVFAICDGLDYVLLSPAQDHKRIFDEDRGPNTGGMGAYAPAPIVTSELMDRIRTEIVERTLRAMQSEGRTYRGVLYCGLMITGKGPRVVEFNCRFGDPETQVVLPLLETDLVEILMAATEGNLASINVRLSSDFAACVVMASGGYPGAYEKGKQILGIEQLFDPKTVVFHAGTASKDGKLVTAGGRVLGVTATGTSLESAIESAYAGVGSIRFEGQYFRRDIGRRGLLRSRSGKGI